MKLGTQTGSVINHLHSRAVIGEPTPVVGMGVTILGWTDRHAGTIYSVTEITSKAYQYVIEVGIDDAKVVAGSSHDGSAQYEFTQRPDRPRSTYRKNRKTGFWEGAAINAETGRLVKSGGKGLRIGEREEYRDPSF